MVLRLFLLFMTIGLLHHGQIVLSLKLSDNVDDLPKESLYQELISDDSIAQMSETEDDLDISDILTEVVGGTPFISHKELVKFLLYTRSNPEKAYHLNIDDDDNLKESPFNSESQTEVIIHGWQNRVTTPWIRDMRKSYLATGDYNVIVVNWDLFAMAEYVVSTRLTRLAGERTGELLKYLNVAADMSLGSVHISGHSLGAHVAGFAGATLSGAVGRITGLDPAGPLFELPHLKKPQDRLDSTDALFVDVIHTCSGALGFARAIGHADFYPNGGSFLQPGCPPPVEISCSHAKAYRFMIDSIIYPDEFLAVQCDNENDYEEGKCSNGNTAIMGEHVSSDTRGTFYLETNAISPYGKGKTT